MSAAPIHSLPSSLSTIEGDAVSFAGGVVIDPAPTVVSDADSDFLTTHLTVADGALSTFNAGGATVTGDGTNELTLSGTVAQVNQALYAVVYTPAPGVSGERIITVTTSDGALSDIDTITVSIADIGIEPVGQDVSRSTAEDVRLQLGATDFPFLDTEGQALTGVLLATLPAHGTIINSAGFEEAIDVTGDGFPDLVLRRFEYREGEEISRAELDAGHVFYVPDRDRSGPDGFTFQVRDAGGPDHGENLDQTPNDFTLDVTPVNDLPTVAIGALGDAIEQMPFDLKGAVLVDDPDGVPLEACAVTLSADYGIFNVDPEGIDVNVSGNGSAEVRLVGTLANLKMLLGSSPPGSVGFFADTDDPPASATITVTINDTLTITFEDGQGGTATALAVIGLTAVDDPAVARDDAARVAENGTITRASLIANDDPDGPSPVISAVNGSSFDVGQSVLLLSGARLKVNADGTFDYDPNGAFGATPASASGAANGPATDSFQYSLASGGSATVTITVDGVDSNDTVLGDGAANTLSGGVGNDVIDGLAGADDMTGGTGNDRFFVDDAADAVHENDGEGTDQVRSTITYILGDFVENLLLLGTGNISGAGNGLANILLGNSGNNFLNGAAGADQMRGDGGSDIYIVDNVNDLVIETDAGVGGGIDRVQSSVTYTLRANVEQLILTGSANINGAGNGLDNLINGNSGNNLLNGAGGADTMKGGLGDDTYIVDDLGDLVQESSAAGGTDRVQSSVSFTLGNFIEQLFLTGSANIDGMGNALDNLINGNSGNNLLDGKAGADLMKGGDGNDQLHGGLGADVLAGGTGQDGFFFETALGDANIDRIVDFSVLGDLIFLENAVFTGLATGTLSTEAFYIGGTAHDVDDRIIYNAATGALLFDADGDGGGAAVQFATLSAGLALGASDFSVI